MSLFVSATIYDTTQNFFTILTMWTKIVHAASNEDNHCPRCLREQHVKNVEKSYIGEVSTKRTYGTTLIWKFIITQTTGNFII